MARPEILLKSTWKHRVSLPHLLDFSFRWNDEDDPPVIPGEQRETRNPGASCFCLHAEHHALWTTRNETIYSACRYVALSLAGVVCLMILPTLALAHGGMGLDEIGPPIMTSGLIGFVSYWAVMLWPSAKKNADQTVGTNGRNLSLPRTERRPQKRSARGKRIPRLRKIKGNGQSDSDQHTRKKASDG